MKLDREPTEAEIAAEMGLDARRWQALMVDFCTLSAASSQTRAEREDQPAQEARAAAELSPEQEFARNQMRNKLSSVMAMLPARHQQVVDLYYHRDLTMKEIGEVLGVNESRVSQIHKNALSRMQGVLSQGGIRSASAFVN